jgi:hypothetical protein
MRPLASPAGIFMPGAAENIEASRWLISRQPLPGTTNSRFRE